MRTQIDWLSFTVAIHAGIENPDGYAVAVENGLHDLFGSHIVKQIFAGNWKERKSGRAPYSESYDVAKTGIVVFCNPKIGNVLVEMSGRACEYVREVGLQSAVLEMAQLRLTRLDLAVDIETDTMPTEFAKKGQYATTKTYSALSSQSGETVYLGSVNSERYTRVYRYKKPHPRAGLLRVEFVFRRKVARAIAQEILVQGEMAIAAAYGVRENFHHACWLPTDTADSFTTFSRPEHGTTSTVFWLVKSVAPAFRRLVREGVISDPQPFLDRYFLSD